MDRPAVRRVNSVRSAILPVVEGLEQRRLLSGQSVTLDPVADAFVRGGSHSATNFGGEQKIYSKENGNNKYDRTAYARFDLPAGLAAEDIGAVTFRTFGGLVGGSDGQVLFGVKAVDSNWQESSVTYNSRPASVTDFLSVATVRKAGSDWVEWDVTQYVKQQVSAGVQTVSFSLESLQTSTSVASFNSREAQTVGVAETTEMTIDPVEEEPVDGGDGEELPEPPAYDPYTPLDIYGPGSAVAGLASLAGGGGSLGGIWGSAGGGRAAQAIPRPQAPRPPTIPNGRPFNGLGTLQFAAVDARTHGSGHTWGHSRSYTTDTRYEHRSINGYGWVVHEQPFLKPWAHDVQGQDSFAVVSASSGPRIFNKQTDGSFVSRSGARDALSFDATNNEYTYRDAAGNVARFAGYGTAANPDATLLPGSMISFRDPGDGETLVAQRAGVGEVNEGAPTVVERRDHTGQLVERFTYTYGDSAGGGWIIQCKRMVLEDGSVVFGAYATANPERDIELLQELQVETLVDGQLTVTQVAEYSYFGFGDYENLTVENGPTGRLASVHTRTYDGTQWSTNASYYRYEASLRNHLAAVVHNDDVARMIADNVAPGTAPMTTFEDYASDTYSFSYATAGAGEVGAHDSPEYGPVTYQHQLSTYSYNANNVTDYRNTWAKRTIARYADAYGPNGAESVTTYVNFYGQPMLEVIRDGQTGMEWRTFYRYSEDGSLLFKADPSAVSGYDHSTPDLMDLQNGDFVHLKDSEGLIRHYEGYDSTTATSTSPGGADRLLKSLSVAQGEDGTPIPTMEVNWLLSDGTPGAPVVADISVFPIEGNTSSKITTSHRYTWFAGTGQVNVHTVTLPEVSAGQNGSGSASTVKAAFDQTGRLRWHADAAGFLSYFEYDTTTGAKVKTIADVDTLQTGDFSFSAGFVTPAGGGAHLIKQQEVDWRGRPTVQTDADGVKTYYVWHDNGAYDDDYPSQVSNYDITESVRIYPRWDTQANRPSVAATYARLGNNGRYIEAGSFTDVPSLSTSGQPDGLESISNFSSLSRSYFDKSGRIIEVDDYFNVDGLGLSIPNPDTHLSPTVGVEGINYYRAEYGYDDRGRANRITDWTGTVYTTTYDALNRPISDSVGVGGVGSHIVTDYEWDLTGSGNSNLTRIVQRVEGDDREVRFFYDWRDRLVLEADGYDRFTDEALFASYYEYDNLGRMTASENYAVAGIDFAAHPNFDGDGDGRPDRPMLAARRDRSQYSFDDRDRHFATEQFFAYESNGTLLSGSLRSEVVYDARSYPVKSSSSEDDLARKTFFDGLGRVESFYLTDASSDTNYVSAFNVAGDTVYEQVNYFYDDQGGGGRLDQVIARQRFHDQTTSQTGSLGNATSGVRARLSHTAYYYDGVGRVSDVVDFGTFGGQAFTRPTSVPSRGDDFAYDAIINSVSYNEVGRVFSAWDPRGTEDRFHYDMLGRVTKAIESYEDGLASVSNDRITEYFHGAAGLERIKATLPGGESQETRYIYGTRAVDGHGVNTNNLLSATQYADPNTGAASSSHVESLLRNRLGEVMTSTDRNGTTHNYTFDRLGRLTADEVVSFGVGVDSSTAKLGFTYDDDRYGGLSGATSFDAANNVINDVLRQYDELGRLSDEYQSVSGAVNTSTTPAIGYGYSPLTDDASRLERLTYSDGRVLGYKYDELGRLESLTDGDPDAAGGGGGSPFGGFGGGSTGGSPTLETYTYLGLSSVVERERPEPDHAWSLLGSSSSSSDSGDWYAGLDKFNRVVDHRWATGGNADLDRYSYGYDPNGNRLFKDNLVNGSLSELYHDGTGYDAFDRLTSFSRGTLTASKDALVGPASRSQDFTLDALGNMLSVLDENNVSEARQHDSQNRLKQVGTQLLQYSPNGEMLVDDEAQQLRYDAWGGLVEIKDAGGTVIAEYAYDAFGRRIVENSTSYLYSASWQVLEEQDAATGQTETQNVWSPVYVDAMILRDRDTDGDGDLTEGGAGSERLYALQDANYNVTAITDESGAVVERYVYDPYGERTILDSNGSPVASDQSAVGFEYGHQGGRHDDSTGLIHFRNRDLKASIQRWTRQDPLGYVDGLNTYGYVGQSPVTLIDPLGLFIDFGQHWRGLKHAVGLYGPEDEGLPADYDTKAEDTWNEKLNDSAKEGLADMGVAAVNKSTENPDSWVWWGLAVVAGGAEGAGGELVDSATDPAELTASVVPGGKAVKKGGDVAQAGIGFVAGVAKKSGKKADDVKDTVKRTKANEPTLPDKTIVDERGVRVEHYTRSNDHLPAHAHVKGEGPSTRIGENGKPLRGDAELSPAQKKVVNDHISTIRSKIKKINNWFRWKNHLSD